MSENNFHAIRFVQSPDYRRIHVTGAWGGINPFGEIVFDLTEDILESPEQVMLTESGERPSPESPNIVRIKHVGVIMPINVAESIVRWLQSKIDAYYSQVEQERRH